MKTNYYDLKQIKPNKVMTFKLKPRDGRGCHLLTPCILQRNNPFKPHKLIRKGKKR